MSVGIIQDTGFYEHHTDGSKERPERVRRLYADIEQEFTSNQLRRFPLHAADDTKICTVHSELYLSQVLSHALSDNPHSYDIDTYLTPESPHVARLAAGGCIRLADALMAGEIDTAFALVRPPGHHAETGRGMGFCIFNNIALTARHLIDCHGLDRILIIDFDTHHGNGTQDIFYQTDQVLTLSIHQNNLFPFSGKSTEIGQGAGLGYNINIPVPPQFADLEYSCLFGTIVQNVIEAYTPQAILVAAGYDAHENDTISQTNLTTEGYYAMTNALRHFAREIDARLLFTLEGGYNVSCLSESVRASLRALTTGTPKRPSFRHAPRAIQRIEKEWPAELLRRWAPAAIGA